MSHLCGAVGVSGGHRLNVQLPKGVWRDGGVEENISYHSQLTSDNLEEVTSNNLEAVASNNLEEVTSNNLEAVTNLNNVKKGLNLNTTSSYILGQ